MMFRAMFNTSFIKSNILILNHDEVDTLWDAKDQFPKDFRAEGDEPGNVLQLVETKGEMKMSYLQPSIALSRSSPIGSSVEYSARFQIVEKTDMKISKLQPSISFPMLTSTGFSVESNASGTSSPVSPHEHTTVGHSSLHGQESGKLKKNSSLPEIKNRPLMTDVLTFPSLPPLPANDQGIVTVPSSQPTLPRDQSPNTVYLKDDRTTVSQLDTSLLPLEMPLSPCENDKIAKIQPVLPNSPSASSSPSGPISNIKHLEEKLINKSGMSPSPPHSAPSLEENSASVCGTPQTPAPPTPPSKFNSVNCSSISGPPQPPSPPNPPLKERLVSKGGMPPPPPLPPLPLPPPPPPLPEQPLKENFPLTGGPCPPPPPPLPSSQASKHKDLYAVPPAPPPPSLVSSLKNNNNLPKSVPSVPPPPVSFPKSNNVPASPSPPPPVAPPPSKNYRRLLSSTMTSRSNSTKKLKPLQWLKISRAVQGSLWSEIEKCSYASKSSVIDMPELEYFFSVRNLDQVGSERNGSSRTTFGQKPQKVQLIDHRRAYNCEIMLSKGYKEQKEKLDRCEQFMSELMQVPRIESKLRVFSFTIQFQSQISELRSNLNIVNSVTDQANILLLSEILADKLPELLDFSKDLSSLEPALKIQLKFLAEEMQAINKGKEKVVDELSMSENDGPMSKNFCKALKEFLSSAEGEVSSLAQLFSGVGEIVDLLIIYFGEDPAQETRKQLEFERKKAEKEAKEKQRTSASNKKT
ncbi:hypothetical protein RND71_036371 [Anisodus tanguticus]|uniref:C2 tensin-type domain-containing protein n=1 Tax=Anisodus tanguticus TaxID=243964 RepID=A0AAE1R3X8_9SOLA|nr:hypothetical protein RND71_036371 [Anisodus tanguticus]